MLQVTRSHTAKSCGDARLAFMSENRQPRRRKGALLIHFQHMLAPFVTELFNTSFVNCIVFDVVQDSTHCPHIEEAYLREISRLISSLNVLSKTSVRLVVRQLSEWKLLPDQQLVYRDHCSTETATFCYYSTP